jgi:hypothetical protein
VITVDQLAARLRKQKLYVNEIMEATDEEGAAAVLGCSVRTLGNWRDEGAGPDCYRAVKWHYPLQALIDFLNSRKS